MGWIGQFESGPRLNHIANYDLCKIIKWMFQSCCSVYARIDYVCVEVVHYYYVL